MTAFQRTDLPDSITTLEKLIVWATTAAQFLSPEATFEEVRGEQTYIIQAEAVKITAGNTPSLRFIARVSLPMNFDFYKGGRMFERVSEISSASIPPEFKS